MKLIITLFLTWCFAFSSSASETVKGAQKDFAEFKQQLQKKMEALDTELEQVQKKAQAKGSEARKKSIAELQAAKQKLQKEIDELQDDGKQEWQKLKSNLADAVEGLSTKVQKALRE